MKKITFLNCMMGAVVTVLTMAGCGHDMQPLNVGPDPGDTVKDSPELTPRNDAEEKETGAPLDPKNASKDKKTTVAPTPLPTKTTSGDTPIDSVTYRWNHVAGGDIWTQYTSEAIDDYDLNTEKTPADIASYCPKYRGLTLDQRKIFWIFIVSSITNLESEFKPHDSYHETFGDREYSRGLMQLSFTSTQGYKCSIHKESDLFIPELNLNCGVKILDHWVGKDGLVAGRANRKWLGGARYWAVLRFKSKIIQGWSKKLPFC